MISLIFFKFLILATKSKNISTTSVWQNTRSFSLISIFGFIYQTESTSEFLIFCKTIQSSELSKLLNFFVDTISEKTKFEISDIIKILPHRYPFILVDKIEIIKPGESLTALKNVTINEPFFQGHFPGNPIMPGVLQIEGMAQTAAVICMLAHNINEDVNLNIFFMTIDKARFRKPVIPGDIIYYYLKKNRQRSSVWKYKGEAYVQGSLIAEAEISAMIDNSTNS